MDADRKTADERKAALALAISQQVALGMRVESQSDFQAIVVKGKPVNHILHGILTAVTLGMWGIVWLILFVTGGQKRTIINVDEYGNALITAV